jgi:hypothetical protein
MNEEIDEKIEESEEKVEMYELPVDNDRETPTLGFN